MSSDLKEDELLGRGLLPPWSAKVSPWGAPRDATQERGWCFASFERSEFGGE